LSQSFTDLGLSAELVRAVAEEGYAIPTPVQVHAIPPILAGRDVLAGAQTGTGKTAGFTLPMLQRLARNAPTGERHAVRALILTPTRELAAQVEESVRTYGRHLPLRSTLVYGGVGFEPQAEALKRGVDILVATPGRLLDHVGQRTVDLRHVEILVLDEADRMLDMGFIHAIRRILALLPAKRQNLLFSATFPDEIRTLANGLLHDPALVEVSRRNAESELVTQRIHPVDQGRKRALLAHLVSSGDWRQVLVFTRTKHGANRLAEQLCRDGIEATAIHGNKSQGARTRALSGFKAGDIRVLVATDIAARGLDIEELPHVVNYELPNVPEHYVHRIGRTGRAGITGEAISLVSADEHDYLADIEKVLKHSLERELVPGFEPGTAPPPHASPARQHPQQRRAPRAPQRPAPAQHRSHVESPRISAAGPTSEQPPASERQPASHANAQFPSSGPAFASPPRRHAPHAQKPRGGGNASRDRRSQVPALLRRSSGRTD
jgi:ATP-dependent RNA helicase RhlE